MIDPNTIIAGYALNILADLTVVDSAKIFSDLFKFPIYANCLSLAKTGDKNLIKNVLIFMNNILAFSGNYITQAFQNTELMFLLLDLAYNQPEFSNVKCELMMVFNSLFSESTNNAACEFVIRHLNLLKAFCPLMDKDEDKDMLMILHDMMHGLLEIGSYITHMRSEEVNIVAEYIETSPLLIKRFEDVQLHPHMKVGDAFANLVRTYMANTEDDDDSN